MDDWGFGIWIVTVVLLAALCLLGAKHFESGQSLVAMAIHRVLSTCSCIGLILVVILVVMHL